jgi:hypothetical protein
MNPRTSLGQPISSSSAQCNTLPSIYYRLAHTSESHTSLEQACAHKRKNSWPTCLTTSSLHAILVNQLRHFRSYAPGGCGYIAVTLLITSLDVRLFSRTSNLVVSVPVFELLVTHIDFISALSGLVRELDLSHIVHHSTKATTARIESASHGLSLAILLTALQVY